MAVSNIIVNLTDNLFAKITLVLVSIIAPLQAVLLTIISLIGVNALTALLASKRRDKFKWKVIKRKNLEILKRCIIYSLVIVLAHYMQLYLLGDTVKLDILVMSFLSLIEFKNILVNLDIISGTKIFSPIIEKIIDLERDETEDVKKVDSPD